MSRFYLLPCPGLFFGFTLCLFWTLFHPKRKDSFVFFTSRYYSDQYSPLETGNLAQTLRESSKIIVIAPDTNETRAFRDWWCEKNPGFPASELWPDKMPELEFLNVPNLCNYIRMMNSSEAIEEYLRTENIGYNPSIPDVFIGIVFDKYPL